MCYDYLNMNVIYILTNPSMPGYIKIGKTSNLEQRIKSLDTTGTPLPFSCFYACEVEDMNEVEKRLHDAFGDHRTRSNREFFEIAPERVVSVLKLVEKRDVTPGKTFTDTDEDRVALEKAQERLRAFSFKLVDIAPDSVLTFTRDENITVTVVDTKNVQYMDEVMSTSKAAQLALGVDYPIQGPLYWEHKGETLDERRKRMELE